MRVLHVHKLTGVSGSERHLLTLLPALRERGIDARFLGLDVANSDAPRFYRELEAAGVPGRHVAYGADVSPRMALDVVRAVRAETPDVVHTHLVHGDLYGAVAGALARAHVVSTRHNEDQYLLGPFRYVDRTFALKAGRLIAISEAVRRSLVAAGHAAGRIETIHYGLDRPPGEPSEITPADAGLPEGAPLVVAVGRLIALKDHATALRAFAAAAERQVDAYLAILGTGPLERETRSLAAELGVADRVFMLGRVEPRDWLARAHVLLHTTRWEGFGLVLLEAMLAGLPVVGTRVSAVPEVVAHGETGILVAPGDWRGAALGLETYLSDPSRRQQAGAAGLRRAREHFSVDRMTERTAAVYERL
jgi:glycosyltransferase involved in cell wall biosynthesis